MLNIECKELSLQPLTIIRYQPGLDNLARRRRMRSFFLNHPNVRGDDRVPVHLSEVNRSYDALVMR